MAQRGMSPPTPLLHQGVGERLTEKLFDTRHADGDRLFIGQSHFLCHLFDGPLLIGGDDPIYLAGWGVDRSMHIGVVR